MISFADIISAGADITAGEVIAVGFKLKCPMSGCTFELQADTKEELMTKGMDHVKTHGMAALSPDMMAKVQAAIKQT
jgi:predicted small metal-binding protein